MLHGRDTDVDRCAAVLARVAAGDGAGGVVLEGEAGMGKSTLLAGVLAAASDERFVVLQGRGHALGRGVAYGPVSAALGRHLHGISGDERARLTEGLGSLARLVEGLGPAPDGGDPDIERSRLVQAVARLLGRMSADQPVLLAVDDLHWVDTATLELLDLLLSEVASERVAVVVASRPGEAATRPDVRHVLGRLRRLPRATRVEVGPLPRASVAELAADLLGGPVDPELVDELVARTGGVALAVEAVVRELVDTAVVEPGSGGWRATGPLSVPLYVVDLFVDRIHALPEGGRLVLAAVVVADDGLDREDLQAIDAGEALDPRSAVAAGLLLETAPGTWDVSHPLVAEAAERTMDETERRRLHAALVDRLGDRGDAALDRRARHVVGAGVLVPDDVAAEVLARAGRRALAGGAFDPAARWLSAAVVRAGSGGLPPADLGRLLLDAADAWERCDELDAALDAAGRAVDVLAADEPSAASRAAGVAGRLCWQIGRPEQHRWHERALELAASSPDRLQVHYEVVGALMREGRTDEVAPAAAQLREDVAGAEGPLADVARYRLVAVDVLVHGGRADRLVDEAPRLPPAAPAPLVAQVEGGILEGCVLLGRWGEAKQRAETTLARLGPDAIVTGLSWRPVVARIHVAFVTGDWDLASDLVTEVGGHTAAALASRGFWLALLAAVRGDAAGAHAAVDEVRSAYDLASLPLHEGALEVVAAYADLLTGGSRPPELHRYRPTWFNALNHLAVSAAAAEVLLAGGDGAGARVLAGRLAVLGAPDTAAGLLARRIEALAADPRVGSDELVSVAEGYDRLGMVFDAARARLEVAERSGGAARLPAEVADTFVRLQATPWAERAAAVAGRGRSAQPAGDLLTRREREVAELVAEGLTNAQIAERLVVSIRTVTSHLDHAYTKLGIGSRAALTAHLLRTDPTRNT